MRPSSMKSANKLLLGFTILEILVVLSVIAILIGIAVPRLKGMQDQANISRAKADLKTLETALTTYFINSNPRAYPPSSTTLAASYLISASPNILAAPLYDPWGSTTTTEYDYVLSANGKYYVLSSVGPNGTLAGCFTAGTQILLANGTSVLIENLKAGDILLGSGNAHNTVIDPGVQPQKDRKIFAFNDNEAFVTEDHVFSTTQGWAALNAALAQDQHPDLNIAQLKTGDILITRTGEVLLVKIESRLIKDVITYNPKIDGSHDYYANNYLVHNMQAVGNTISDTGVVTKGADDICVTNGSGCVTLRASPDQPN